MASNRNHYRAQFELLEDRKPLCPSVGEPPTTLATGAADVAGMGARRRNSRRQLLGDATDPPRVLHNEIGV